MYYVINPMPYDYFSVSLYNKDGGLVGCFSKEHWTVWYYRQLDWFRDNHPDLLLILTDNLKELGLLPM